MTARKSKQTKAKKKTPSGKSGKKRATVAKTKNARKPTRKKSSAKKPEKKKGAAVAKKGNALRDAQTASIFMQSFAHHRRVPPGA